MWKGKKPERDKEPSAAISKFQEGKTMETWLEPKSTPAEKEIINVGKSVSIKGDLTGDEDLIIDGQVEGKIELQDHDLVIGSHGKVNAQINAKNVIVMGKVVGKIYAADLVDIKRAGSVVGDIKSSRISIAESAYFKGSVELKPSADTRGRLHSPVLEPAKVNTKQPALAQPAVNLDLATKLK